MNLEKDGSEPRAIKELKDALTEDALARLDRLDAPEGERRALNLAARLFEPGEEDRNPEYFRGVSEILGEIFPWPGQHLVERAADIRVFIRLLNQGKAGLL